MKPAVTGHQQVSTPDDGAAGRMRPLAPFAISAAAVGVGTLALRLRDPHQPGSWGFCPTALMGFDCPGCGTLRAVNLLAQGDLAGAASSNLLFVISVPFVIAWWLLALVRTLKGHPRPWFVQLPPAVWWGALALVVAFTLVRNVSWFGSLSTYLAS